MSYHTTAVLMLLQLLIIGEGSCAQNQEEATAERHRRVTGRRGGVHIICHRGAVEFAHENTMEAYLAAFELGADGNEIDIRATKDVVLVCFHDDNGESGCAVAERCRTASCRAGSRINPFHEHESGWASPLMRLITRRLR